MRTYPIFRTVLFITFLLLIQPLHAVSGATYYSDPQNGNINNRGNRSAPWPALQKIIESQLLQRLQPGDTLLLRSGYHGTARFSGKNERIVTIAAMQGERPTLGKLEIKEGTKWTIRGLSISPEYGPLRYSGPIVSLGEYGPSSELILEDCYVFGSANPEKLDARKWIALNNGIYLGRNGNQLTSRNNYVFNTRHAIQSAASDSLIEGCVVENFSGDAIRLMQNGCVARWNVLRNGYCDEKHDGDRNHDDLLQCFQFGKGTGELRNIKIEENLLISHTSAEQPFPGQVQGIGLFDGPLVGFTITGNVISVDHWHGLTLVDAQNCLISNNVVWSPKLDSSQFRPWIMLGEKKSLAKDNHVTENFACLFRLEQPGTKESNNRPATQEIFNKARKKLSTKIVEKFGRVHQTARKERFSENQEK